MSEGFRTLRANTQRHRSLQRVKLPTDAKHDVDSIQIRPDNPRGLKAVQLSSGGVPFMSFTPEMLKKLPVTNGWIEILQPFLTVLPLTKLVYHLAHLDRKFDAPGAYPLFEVRIKQCNPVEELNIPMLQPFPKPNDLTATDTYGIFTAPNEFVLMSGMGHARRRYLGERQQQSARYNLEMS